MQATCCDSSDAPSRATHAEENSAKERMWSETFVARCAPDHCEPDERHPEGSAYRNSDKLPRSPFNQCHPQASRAPLSLVVNAPGPEGRTTQEGGALLHLRRSLAYKCLFRPLRLNDLLWELKGTWRRCVAQALAQDSGLSSHAWMRPS